MRKYIRSQIVGVLCIGALVLGVVVAGEKDKPPAATKAATAAAPRPAAYPPAQLIRQCNQASKDLKAKLDETFHIVVDPPFVVAGNMPPADLRACTRGTVLDPAKAMWASYFKAKPDHVITVLLFTDKGAAPPDNDKEKGYVYRSWARKLFGDTDVSYFGYYKPDKRTMVMNIDTGGGTLVHELTHALIVYDFPSVPDWFNEGLGSLHEQCNIAPDKVTGLVNWRLPMLKVAIRQNKLRSLKSLLTADDFRRDKAIVLEMNGQKKTVGQVGLNYAQARYFCMYMQEKGVLKDFYVYLRDHAADKDAGVAAAEKVFKDKIENIEKAYLDFAKGLKYGE